MRRPLTAILAALALGLSACGDDDAGDAAAAAADASDATDDASADADGTGAGGDDAETDADPDADDGAGTDDVQEAEVIPFDPSVEVPFKQIEYSPLMSDEVILPFENMLVPDDLPWPATVRFVQAAEDTSEATEPVRSNNGAFRVLDPDADVDTVMGFFDDRLPGFGWELEEERPNDNARWTQWARKIPSEDPERSNDVQLRIEYLAPDDEIGREHGALRWWVSVDDSWEPYEG